MIAGSVLHADPIVQAVILILLLGSVASWAVILEKLFALRRLGREVRHVEGFARGAVDGMAGPSPLLAQLLAARDAETGVDGETLRASRLAAVRGAAVHELRSREGGLSYLATLASTAPFIGLFGTVWGIMRSFSAIADSNDTSLAVVAPGIAEALFATAIGLAAAIPAVIGYNLVRSALRRYGHRLAAAAELLAKQRTMIGREASR